MELNFNKHSLLWPHPEPSLRKLRMCKKSTSFTIHNYSIFEVYVKSETLDMSYIVWDNKKNKN